MADSRTDQSARRLALWFDPEMAAYALVGLLVVGLSARALAGWVGRSWVDGQRTAPAVVLALVVAAAASSLFVLRCRKRWLYLGLVLVAVGFVSFLLTSAGFTLPRSWLV
jgi:sugar phosphate permease